MPAHAQNAAALPPAHSGPGSGVWGRKAHGRAEPALPGHLPSSPPLVDPRTPSPSLWAPLPLPPSRPSREQARGMGSSPHHMCETSQTHRLIHTRTSGHTHTHRHTQNHTHLPEGHKSSAQNMKGTVPPPGLHTRTRGLSPVRGGLEQPSQPLGLH